MLVDATGDRDARQAAAILERLEPDGSDAGANRDVGQEGISLNAPCATYKRSSLQICGPQFLHTYSDGWAKAFAIDWAPDGSPRRRAASVRTSWGVNPIILPYLTPTYSCTYYHMNLSPHEASSTKGPE